MKAAHGRVFKYGDNVDTDVIIPARYLNSSDPKELATHCMEDIDKDFVNNVKDGDIIGQVDSKDIDPTDSDSDHYINPYVNFQGRIIRDKNEVITGIVFIQ